MTIYDSGKIRKDIGGMLSSLLYVKDRHGVKNNPHVASFIDAAHNVSTALNVNDDLVENNDEVFVRAMNVLSDLKRLKDLLDSLKGIKVTNFPPRYQAQINGITNSLGAVWENRATSTLDYIREYTTSSDFMTLKDALKRASLNTSLISPKDYLKQEPEKAGEAVLDEPAVQANNKVEENGATLTLTRKPPTIIVEARKPLMGRAGVKQGHPRMRRIRARTVTPKATPVGRSL